MKLAQSALGQPGSLRKLPKVNAVYSFHVNLLAASPGVSFAVTWEQVAAELERLPRMVFEPDGSFVVSGDDERGRRWQVDGHLFDFAGRLQRVELHGACPGAAFDELLHCVGWPEQALEFELVRLGRRLDEAGFRCHAGGAEAHAR